MVEIVPHSLYCSNQNIFKNERMLLTITTGQQAYIWIVPGTLGLWSPSSGPSKGVISTPLLQIVAESSSFSRTAKKLGFYVKLPSSENSIGQVKPYL